MSQKGIDAIKTHFATTEDPRVEYLVEHNLLKMIVIAICAVICGANNWVAVADWGVAKEEWLRQYLKLEHGTPSHDAFRRVCMRIDPEQFQSGFASWIGAVFKIEGQEHIAIDGKEMHGSKSKTLGRRAIDMVSAWATQARLVLGQRKVDEKSNEITAIPALLKMLDLEGCVVTIDAIGCQTEIANQIVEQGGDYLLSVKGNQGCLQQDIAFIFDKQIEPFDILPQVEPKKGQRNQQQAKGRYLTSCACPSRVHQTVTGLDAKTTAILFGYLGGLSFERPNNDISKTEHTLTLVFTLAVFADDNQGQCFLAIDGASAVIGCGVAFTSHQQSPRATLLTTNNQRNDGGKWLFLQISYQAIIVKTPVEIEALNAQSQMLTIRQQPLKDILCFFLFAHQHNGQGIPPVLFNDIQRSKDKEMGCATFGLSTTHKRVIRFMLPMIRQFNQVYGYRQLAFEQLARQLGRQQLINIRFHVPHLTHIFQHLFDHCSYHCSTGGGLQQFAGHFDANPFDRCCYQDVPNVLSVVISVLHIQLEMFLQRGTYQLINILCSQLLGVTILFSHFRSSFVKDCRTYRGTFC
jgi:hypothetical protein